MLAVATTTAVAKRQMAMLDDTFGDLNPRERDRTRHSRAEDGHCGGANQGGIRGGLSATVSTARMLPDYPSN